MRSVPTFILTVATACLPFASACMQDGSDLESGSDSEAVESTESDLDVIEPIIIPPGFLADGCKTAAPDKIHYILSTTGRVTSPSPDGGYRYNTSDLCGRWVVDFKFGASSPVRELSGAPYDLPSSAGAGGMWPTNAYDCTHLRVVTSIYRKKSTETAFTLLTAKTSTGVWSSGSCIVARPSVSGLPAASGWDTYRVAVATKLRGAWQQTAALADYPPVP